MRLGPSTSQSMAPQETEPEGFGDAVATAALMLAIVTVLAGVGFQWQRGLESAAHRAAVDLVAGIARDGDHALVPVWSGLGRGPGSSTARETFRALQGLGPIANPSGRCHVRSRPALCEGTRYQCHVSGMLAAGPMQAKIGLCSMGGGTPYTFDSFDLAIPLGLGSSGNRHAVEVARDGQIRYGNVPLEPESLPVRQHRRHLPGQAR